MIRSLRFARGQWGALHATRHGTRALCGRHVVEIPAGTIVAASEPTCAKCRGMARAAAGHVAIGILTDQLNDESVEPEVRAALARLVSSAERWWCKP
jgi:hypothetical protein